MRSLCGRRTCLIERSFGRFAVPCEKASKDPVYFRMIYQTHMRGRDMDYMPLKHLGLFGNDQIVAAIDGNECGCGTERALSMICEYTFLAGREAAVRIEHAARELIGL